MNVHYFQHVPYETPGILVRYFAERGHRLEGTHWYRGESAPAPESYESLVVMGGPMNIYEEQQYPWLAEEKSAIKAAIRQGKKILGICLGAQLIADVLGAPTRKNPEKEIGWFPVTLRPETSGDCAFHVLPDRITPFHWHGETFDLPEGAVPLFNSEACTNQGFLYRNQLLALQFHLEITPEGVQQLIANAPQDLTPGPWVQSPEEMLKQEQNFHQAQHWLSVLLDQFYTLPPLH